MGEVGNGRVKMRMDFWRWGWGGFENSQFQGCNKNFIKQKQLFIWFNAIFFAIYMTIYYYCLWEILTRVGHIIYILKWERRRTVKDLKLRYFQILFWIPVFCCDFSSHFIIYIRFSLLIFILSLSSVFWGRKNLHIFKNHGPSGKSNPIDF